MTLLFKVSWHNTAVNTVHLSQVQSADTPGDSRFLS